MSAGLTELNPTSTQQPVAARLRPLWQRAAALGTGLGIDVSGPDLYAAIVHTRLSGPILAAETTIAEFRKRPAAEWGTELSAFLAASASRRLAATLVLPRSAVIVRSILVPGVADKDLRAAIELQIDTLHPHGNEEIFWDFARTASGHATIAIVRSATLEEYETLFGEAGIRLAGVSCAATVIHPAIRVWTVGHMPVVTTVGHAAGSTEVYGESTTRPLYSAEMNTSPDRALAVARSELRLAPDTAETPLSHLLPLHNVRNPQSAVACTAAIAGAAAKISDFVNLLPAARRVASSRMEYLIPGALVVIAVVVLLGSFVILPEFGEQRYRAGLDGAAKALEPTANRARELERQATAARARIAALDEFRARPQMDLDALADLTRLIEPPGWTNSIELYPDSIVINGETNNAAPIVKQLDSSTLFQNSEFVSSVVKSQGGEQFHIRTMRRGRIGRTTP